MAPIHGWHSTASSCWRWRCTRRSGSERCCASSRAGAGARSRSRCWRCRPAWHSSAAAPSSGSSHDRGADRQRLAPPCANRLWGVSRPSPLGRAAGPVPALAFLGAGAGDRGCSRIGRVSRLGRPPFGQARRDRACRALGPPSRRGLAPAGGRVPSLARLAKDLRRRRRRLRPGDRASIPHECGGRIVSRNEERTASNQNRRTPMLPARLARLAAAALVIAGWLGAGMAARAEEVREIRIAKQFGISYLPITVMEAERLVEKHAKAAGLGEVKVTWAQFSSGAPMNDALLSNSLDIVSGGVGPLLTIWARPKGNLNVQGGAALNPMPLYLNTINPTVKTIKALTEKARIRPTA